MQNISLWLPNVVNHFWYCCSQANGDAGVLKVCLCEGHVHVHMYMYFVRVIKYALFHGLRSQNSWVYCTMCRMTRRAATMTFHYRIHLLTTMERSCTGSAKMSWPWKHFGRWLWIRGGWSPQNITSISGMCNDTCCMLIRVHCTSTLCVFSQAYRYTRGIPQPCTHVQPQVHALQVNLLFMSCAYTCATICNNKVFWAWTLLSILDHNLHITGSKWQLAKCLEHHRQWEIHTCTFQGCTCKQLWTLVWKDNVCGWDMHAYTCI